MVIKTEAKALTCLWETLRDQKCHPHPQAAARRVSFIVKRGWAPRHDVQDLLHDLGAGWWLPHADVNALFDAPKQAVYERPRSGLDGVMGFEETAAADLAFILIQIERLGLGIDPSPLIDAIRPTLLSRSVLTRSELAVFWYARERHRLEPIKVTTDEGTGARSYREERLPTGYKAEVVEQDGQVRSLTVNAPKYRRRRSALAA